MSDPARPPQPPGKIIPLMPGISRPAGNAARCCARR